MDRMLSVCKEKENTLIALRREFHKVPEIGGELPLTKQIVMNQLDSLGIPYTLNPDDDGLVAVIRGKKAGKTLAFRADMDGLHIEESTNVPFRSGIAGQMHGCGHDAHTAILLTAAEILNQRKEQLAGNVKLLFQSGEETGTGAKCMIACGAVDDVDAICSIHVGNLAGDDHNAGDIIILPGAVSAGKDKFTITVHGKGTHSAFPEKGIDPILIGARIVNACEELTARELPAGTAAVLSFGSFQAGQDHNTIPPTAVLKGSIRVQDPKIRDFLGNRLKELSVSIANAFRGSCDVEIKKGSQTVVNDPSLSSMVAEAVAKAVGQDKVFSRNTAALMGSDDFANYATMIPAVYFFLHTNNPEKGIVEANHNPSFDIDESVLWEGVASYVAIASEYLK